MIKINPKTDLLFVTDMQVDFITGSLAVKGAELLLPIVKRYMALMPRQMFSKDDHPKNHSSFTKQGGIWPDHCVKNTEGNKIHPDLEVNEGRAQIISKAVEVDKDTYSAFEDTGLSDVLPFMGVKRMFVCGLTTDYCVLATVLDALKIKGIEIFLLVDAIKAVEVNPGDGEAAINKMIAAGATPITLADIEQ